MDVTLRFKITGDVTLATKRVFGRKSRPKTGRETVLFNTTSSGDGTGRTVHKGM